MSKMFCSKGGVISFDRKRVTMCVMNAVCVA